MIKQEINITYSELRVFAEKVMDSPEIIQDGTRFPCLVKWIMQKDCRITPWTNLVIY